MHTTRGSLVHRALELAYSHPADATAPPSVFHRCLAVARRRVPPAARLRRPRARPTSSSPSSTTTAARSSTPTSRWRTRQSISPIGLELRLSAEVGALTLRGIIDRLELRDGELVVTDYKTGRAPSTQLGAAQPRRRALLLVPVRAGARPATGRDPADVPAAAARSSRPCRRRSRSASSPRAPRRCGRPSSGPASPATSGRGPSGLCASCSFQQWCPSFGGDPERAAAEAPLRRLRAGAGRPRDVRPSRAGPASSASTTGPTRPSNGSAATRSPTPCSPRPPSSATSASIWHLVNVGPRAHQRAPGRPGPRARHRPRRREPRRQPGPQAPVPDGAGRPSEGDPRYPVRRPLTSSFPSGHASAAAFAAVVLTAWDGRRSAPLWWTVADGRRRQPGLRPHPPRVRRRRRRWPPAPSSASCARRRSCAALGM